MIRKNEGREKEKFNEDGVGLGLRNEDATIEQGVGFWVSQGWGKRRTKKKRRKWSCAAHMGLTKGKKKKINQIGGIGPLGKRNDWATQLDPYGEEK